MRPLYLVLFCCLCHTLYSPLIYHTLIIENLTLSIERHMLCRLLPPIDLRQEAILHGVNQIL